MNKIWIAQIIFLIVEIIGFIPLSMEVFGHMNPDRIIIFAYITGSGLIGSSICGLMRSSLKNRNNK